MSLPRGSRPSTDAQPDAPEPVPRPNADPIAPRGRQMESLPKGPTTMGIAMISALASALATAFAGVALILNTLQFRRVDKSLRGNTHQLLQQQLMEYHKLLIEHSEIEYLYTKTTPPGDRTKRIARNILGTLIENIWLQRGLGLVDDDYMRAIDTWIIDIVREHPEMESMTTSDRYPAGLRNYILNLLATAPLPANPSVPPQSSGSPA